MSSNKEDKFSVYYGVRNTCEGYRPAWVTNAVFTATYNLWVAKFPLIEANKDVQALECSNCIINNLCHKTTSHKNQLNIEFFDR